MKKTILVSAAMALAACSHVGWDTTRLGSLVTAYEYNSIANKYYSRPTFSELVTYKSGKSYLSVTMDAYGQKYSEIRFTKDKSADYIALIDKYLEWEKQATAHGDMVDKKIGAAGGFANSINFRFFSSNQYNHYLSLDTLGVNELFFTRTGAMELREALSAYESGKITQSDTDSKYQ